MVSAGPRRRRPRRFGQNFLADPTRRAAIVRVWGVGGDAVGRARGGGGGALSELLAPAVRRLHVIELDEALRPELEGLASEHGNVEVTWGDAMRVDLGALDPAPAKVVSNLPYSIATPVLLRTIEELPGVASWTVMVQREIADRLRADPGSRTYGAPSVLVQLAADVELLRKVDRAVFTPRPRVDSALLRLTRRGPAADADVRELVRGAFAHRRKAMARSLELAGYDRDAVRAAMREAGRPEDARAEALAPGEFARVAGLVEAAAP